MSRQHYHDRYRRYVNALFLAHKRHRLREMMKDGL